MGLFMWYTLIVIYLGLKRIFLLYLIYFWGIQSSKVRVRLKLGFFSHSNILKMGPVVNPKVGVRLKLGCGLN